MPNDPETKAVEDALISDLLDVLYKMTMEDSKTAKSYLEKLFRPRLRLRMIDIKINEAKRCEAYRVIGSPRVIQLEAERNEVAIQVAMLDADKRKP